MGWVYLPGSEELSSDSNGRDSVDRCALSKKISNAVKSSRNNFRKFRYGTTSKRSEGMNGEDGLMLFPEEIHVLVEAKQKEIAEVKAPIFPGTSCQSSDSSGPGSWSAKMFLHEIMLTLRLPWSYSATERLLSEWTPLHIQGKAGSGISLSEYVEPREKISENVYLSRTAVAGLLRRLSRRGLSFRVLLRTRTDIIPLILSFTMDDSGCLKVEKLSDLEDIRNGGMKDLAYRLLDDLSGMQLCRNAQNISGD